MKNTKIIYDKESNSGFEYIKLSMSRLHMRNFMNKGNLTMQKTLNGTMAHLISPQKLVFSSIIASMTIGDIFEGKRVNDIKCEKCVIDHQGKKVNTIVFIYKFD